MVGGKVGYLCRRRKPIFLCDERIEGNNVILMAAMIGDVIRLISVQRGIAFSYKIASYEYDTGTSSPKTTKTFSCNELQVVL